jgi:hypothetical protein
VIEVAPQARLRIAQVVADDMTERPGPSAVSSVVIPPT